jgi:type IV secretory pathway VirB4 component
MCDAFEQHIDLLDFVADKPVYATKRLDLGLVVRVQPIDPECLSIEEREDRTLRFRDAIARFHEQYRIYQTLSQTKRPIIGIDANHPNEVVAESLKRTANLFEQRREHLYSREFHFTFLLEAPPIEGLLATPRSYWNDIKHGDFWGLLSPDKRVEKLTEREVARAETLLTSVESFCSQVSDLLDCRISDRSETKRFLRSLLTFRNWNRAQICHHDTDLDYWLPNARPSIYHDYVRCDGHYLRAITLRETPRVAGDAHDPDRTGTHAAIFWGIPEIDCGLIATVEWHPLSRIRCMREVDSRQARQHGKIYSAFKRMNKDPGDTTADMRANEAAKQNVSDLGQAQVAIDGGNFLGQFSVSILLYDEQKERVDASVPEAVKAFKGALALPEDTGTFDTWMGAIPGNKRHNVRSDIYTTLDCYADMSLIWGDNTEDRYSKYLPDRRPLTYFETASRSIFPFYPNVEDVIGILIFGQQGGGKTTMGGHLLDVFRKYRVKLDRIWAAPKTFVMDIKDSYRENTLRHGGTYLTLSLDNPGALRRNPFGRPHSKENVERILRLMKLMLAGDDGFKTTPEQDVRIVEEIQRKYLLKERGGLRMARLGAMHLGKDLQPRLEPWIGNGQYAAFFDNPEDTLMDCDWLTVQYSGFRKHSHVLLPLLFWDWEWFDDLVYDEALTRVPKLFLADELHVQMLMSPVIGPYLLNKINTGRSYNLWNIFILQWATLLEKHDIGASLNAACPMKIFTASENIRAKDYERIFEISPHVAEQIKRLIPKRQVLVHTARYSKIVNVHFDPETLAIYANDVESNATRYERERKVVNL